MDSSPAAKRVKEEPEDKPKVQPEESMFEAARRRHASLQAVKKEAQPGDGSSAAKTDAKESHSDWEARWMNAYPSKALVRAVGAVRRSTSTAPVASTLDQVYVIVHMVTDDYVYHALPGDVLGTYTDVNLANEHVLGYFSDEYAHFAKVEEFAAKRGLNRPYRDYHLAWDVDSDGCLVLEGEDKHGNVKVFVSKQTVRDRLPEVRNFKDFSSTA